MTTQSTRKILTGVAPLMLIFTATAWAATGNEPGHPGPQPRVEEGSDMDATREVIDDGMTTIWETKETHFPESKPFQTSQPSNVLPKTLQPMRDSGGDIIPNSVPSTPSNPYNLHPDPKVDDDIDPRSPRWDLHHIINELKASVFPKDRRATNREFFRNGQGVPADPRRGRVERKGPGAGTIEERATPQIDYERVQFAIDILEGNEIDREYSGMPLLHYMGPNMVKKVDPETNTVTVRQAWMRSRIKSDTMFIDPSTIPANEEWTIRYEASVLHWGHEDFAPFGVFFDDPQDVPRPNMMHFAMDQSFFPMETGKKYTFEVKMPPHRYWNLTYNWGWRVHPPRIQAIEKALKKPMGKNIVEWESDVFGEDPRASEQAKLEAISMLADLAPAKRMWKAFRAIEATQPGAFTRHRGGFRGPMGFSLLGHGGPHQRGGRRYLQDLVAELEAAFEDWKDRSKLPRGVEQAEGYDQTLVYLNNHLYGGMHDVEMEAEENWSEWQKRGATLKTKIYNGDYFPHAYMNVDFGGRRGWENIYQSTIPLGGQGPWFTFGRAHMSRNLQLGNQPKPELVSAAERLPAYMRMPAGMMDLSTIGQPSDPGKTWQFGLNREPGKPAHPRPALPPATHKALTSEWLQHPGAEIAAYRGGTGLGEHNIEITYNFEPSTRLRFYQFDPLHHNENILSIH